MENIFHASVSDYTNHVKSSLKCDNSLNNESSHDRDSSNLQCSGKHCESISISLPCVNNDDKACKTLIGSQSLDATHLANVRIPHCFYQQHCLFERFGSCSDEEKTGFLKEENENLSGNRLSKIKPHITFSLCLAILFAVIGSAFICGWNTSILNNPETIIKNFLNETFSHRKRRNISANELALIWTCSTSTFALGAAFGGSFIGYFANKYGRKVCLIANAVLGMISCIIQTISGFVHSYECLIFGRLLIGFQGGASLTLCALYLNEISAKEFRGALGIITNGANTFGIFVASFLGMEMLLGRSNLYSALFGLQLIPLVICIIGLLFCPETPPYLFIKKRDHDSASKALRFLRGRGASIADELDLINEEKAMSENEKTVKLLELFTNARWKKRTLIILTMQISQQLSGINALMFYSKGIFKTANLNDQQAIYGTVGVTSALFLMTVVSAFVIDRIGRKVLLLIGYVTTSITCLALVAFLHFSETVYACGILSIVCMLIYICGYAVGPAGIPWMISAELFPQNARVKAVSIATFMNFLFAFFIILIFPIAQQHIGSYIFILFGVCSILSAVFTMICVPETKGKSNCEIEQMFVK